VQLFPEEPEFVSPAEKTVWQALRDQLPASTVLFHGLRLSDRKTDREADVVAAIPGVGIAVIEVKGGQIGLSGGTWTQTSRNGSSRRIHPVDQALECKYLLRRYLRNHPGWRHGDPRMMHLVAFPFTDIPTDFTTPSCPRWMVIGRADLDRAGVLISDALDRAETPAPPPTAEDLDDLVGCVAGRMLPYQDLTATVSEREAHCDLLTARQGKILDAIRWNRRVEVRGGAGSGKTWLAVEQARRLAASGQRVGLICYSRGLAAYLRRRVSAFPEPQRPGYVGTFHGLGIEWLGAPHGSDDDSSYWERHLPSAMAGLAADRPERDRFDAFVIDEAQDFSDAWWPAVQAALRDPATGGMYVFADEGQRVFARQGRPPVDLVPIALDENLRNTKPIAQTFGSLAPMQMRYRGGDGDPVSFIPHPSDHAIGAADDAAVSLLDNGWAPAHVALLTTGRRHPMQVEHQARGQSAYWRSYWDGDDLFYGHVLGFKGLERPAVVLAVNGFRDRDRAPEMLYVGLSRARDLLIVIGDPDLLHDVGGPAVARRLGII
jgi:hypothetical protein